MQVKWRKGQIPIIKNMILVATSFVVFVSCGGFEANHHPDDNFNTGQGIGSPDQFGQYINGNGQDPRFRRAQVTTQSSPLRLKTEPSTSAPSPSTGERELARGSIVTVYWPLDIVNNHVKVYVAGRTLWVTHRSSGGQEYVTLQEDIYLPENRSLNSGVISLPTNSSLGTVALPFSGGGSRPQMSNITSSLETVSLSSSAIHQARTAISAVNLSSADVAACSFNPAVGNNASRNNCYRQIVISRPFRDFVARYGQECAVSAGRAAFGQTPTKVLFHSSGAGQVRADRTVGNTSTKSTHATGQAFDLYGISVYFSGNNHRRIPLHRDSVDGSSTEERQNHTYYWAFANCWRQRVQAHAPCGCNDSKTGALTYTDNSAHYNHLHMSLPMCERTRYNVSCI